MNCSADRACNLFVPFSYLPAIISSSRIIILMVDNALNDQAIIVDALKKEHAGSNDSLRRKYRK